MELTGISSPVGGKTIQARLQIPINCLIGDTDGHDKLMARKVDRASGQNRLCRYCDVSFLDTGNPCIACNKKGKLTRCSTIWELA